jgi:hypothetical protein
MIIIIIIIWSTVLPEKLTGPQLLKKKVQYCIHKSPPPVPIQSLNDPVHASPILLEDSVIVVVVSSE